MMHITSGLCKLLYGWTFGEASALESVSKTQVPMLFIHGGNDDRVPTAMVYPLYNACRSRKALWADSNSNL